MLFMITWTVFPETMELEYISELSESVNIGVGLVNTPITETEVLM